MILLILGIDCDILTWHSWWFCKKLGSAGHSVGMQLSPRPLPPLLQLLAWSRGGGGHVASFAVLPRVAISRGFAPLLGSLLLASVSWEVLLEDARKEYLGSYSVLNGGLLNWKYVHERVSKEFFEGLLKV